MELCILGMVIHGLDVVDIVAGVSTDNNDKPVVEQDLNSIVFVREYTEKNNEEVK